MLNSFSATHKPTIVATFQELNKQKDVSPAHKLKFSIMEHTAKPQKHRELKKLGRQLGDYCTILPGDENAERCWTAYHFYEKKKKALLEECHNQEVRDKLEKFEDAMRELQYAGLPNIVNTLYHMAIREQGATAHLSHIKDTQKQSLTVDQLQELFDIVDTNKNGEIDIGQFRDAMDIIGDHLSGQAVATICQAMDVHGFLNFQQFQAIVEAEEIASHSATSRVLRSICNSDKPAWWSDCPESLA
eukprot:TRINITY_DN714_c0_g1_i5.p2 TRINITY_DN714_c0_g1~~TRINITY_DN714_c0_g1_i5.p2  ORF type:complete len:245 (-),score=32.47 TRINITY_DN714_c0_g1_i5:384-1118(-)